VVALTDLATRRLSAETGHSSPAVDSDAALRKVLQAHVLPIYTQLLHDPLFVNDVVHAGAASASAEFSEAFLQPEVLDFLNEHRSALQVLGIVACQLGMNGRYALGFVNCNPIPRFESFTSQSMFSNYALGGKALLDAQSAAQVVQGSSAVKMSRKAALAWAMDYFVVPDMVSRPELVSLFREVVLA
jgi:hypothetical protein